MRQVEGTVCADPASGIGKQSQQPVSSAKKPLAPGSAEKMSNFHHAVVEGRGRVVRMAGIANLDQFQRLNPSGKCRIKSADHTGGRNSIFWKMSVDYETEIGRRVCS